MPNTLAHLGVQTVLTRVGFPQVDLKWIWAGCILPDLPWIAQRMVRAVFGQIDPFDLRLYAVVQSSLFMTLILAAGLALLARRPLLVFAVLTWGVTLHLLLDATQTKWANGVLLFAPFSWHMTHFDLFWPESWPSYAMTGLGVLVVLWVVWREQPQGVWPITLGVRRALAALTCLLVYLLLPLVFLGSAAEADLHYTTTLRTVNERPGAPVEVDRSALEWRGDLPVLTMSMGPELVLEGDVPQDAQLVSVRGTFTDTHTISVDDLRVHPPGQRALFSYFGLALVLTWWSVALLRRGQTQTGL